MISAQVLVRCHDGASVKRNCVGATHPMAMRTISEACVVRYRATTSGSGCVRCVLDHGIGRRRRHTVRGWFLSQDAERRAGATAGQVYSIIERQVALNSPLWTSAMFQRAQLARHQKTGRRVSGIVCRKPGRRQPRRFEVHD